MRTIRSVSRMRRRVNCSWWLIACVHDRINERMAYVMLTFVLVRISADYHVLYSHIRNTDTMTTGETVVTLLVVLATATTSSVTSMYHLQSPGDVSQRARHDANSRSYVMSQSRADVEDMMPKRTPGWGKRLDVLLPALSPYTVSKRRGWGKRDIGNNCAYWLSLLQFIEVRICVIYIVICTQKLPESSTRKLTMAKVIWR